MNANRRYSISFEKSSNSSNISLLSTKEDQTSSLLESSMISKSSMHLLDPNEGLTDYCITELDNYHASDSLIGNSNTIALSFNFGSIIKHIEWISSLRMVAWYKKAFYLIDLKTRTISEPFNSKFDAKSNSITQIFFSKSRTMMCVILNHKNAYILDIESKIIRVIESVYFNKIITKDNICLCGCFSPDENHIVFSAQNMLFIGKITCIKSMNLMKVSFNFEFISSLITWKDHGILIGTEKGTVFIIPKKKVGIIYESPEIRLKEITIIYDQARSGNDKPASIKHVRTCANRSYAIIDSTGKGVIITGDIQQTIADDIVAFRSFSKETFLVRLLKYNMLIAMNAIGEFVPPPPPCFFAAIKSNYSFKPKKVNLIELSDENDSLHSIIQQLFRINVENPSFSIRNSIQLLNQVVSSHVESKR